MLVGRDREQTRLTGVIEDARRSVSRTLAVVGDPGVGKTALLAHAREQAPDLFTLTSVGVESESELAYASLHELLSPLIDRIPQLAPVQAQALAAALALEEGGADALAVGAGTYSLLALVAEERPVLVLLDDVHWFDGASARAIAFAIRRFKAEQVGVILAFRPGAAPLFESLPELILAPLGPAEARALLRTRAQPLAPADESRLLAAAVGNPLALLELPPELAHDLPRALTEHQRLERAFGHRLASVDPAVRAELLLAAAEPDAGTVRRASKARGTTAALHEAEKAGLVRVQEGSVLFRHPVLRALVYASASEAERASAHEHLARVLHGDADRDRRAWHLAAAADGPDEELAELLEETADRALARGGQAAAARALAVAARLTPDRTDRARRLLAAARAELQGVGSTRARTLIEEALTLTDDELLRFDLLLELHRATDWTDVAHPDATFLHEIERLEHVDDLRLARALMILLSRRTASFDVAGAVELARRLERHAPGAGPDWGSRAWGLAASAYVRAGDRAEATRCLAAALHPDMPTMGFFDFMALERIEEVRHSLAATLRQARADGNYHRIIWNRTCAAHLELRCGRLARAEEAAGEAIRLGELLDEPKAELGYAVLAGVYAWRGSDDDAASAARRAAAAARIAGDIGVEATAYWMLALLALGRGEPADAVAHLAPMAERWLRSDVRDPCAAAFVPDLAQAYGLTGDLDAAQQLLDRFTTIAEAFDNAWTKAASLRSRGLLAPDNRYQELFEGSLALLEPSPYVLDRARTRLAYGERLRRDGHRVKARLLLQAAYDSFASAGATLWQGRAANELRATGVRVSSPEAPLGELTPQELAIATLAASGKSNPEIAAAVFLSRKTVEYHLSNTFRKLDVHSRVELANVMADRA